MALLLAQDYIYQALRKLGHLRAGYAAQAELMNDALNEWDTMFDAFNAERLMQFTNPDYVYPVTGPGSQSGGNGYQIGPTAADWVGPRPEIIIHANLVQTTVGPQPVYIPIKAISQEQWANLAIRQIPAVNITAVFWYDPQFPNAVFNVFPPLSGNSIELFQTGVLVPPTTLSSAFSAPPGYQDLIIKSLAQRLYYMVPKMLMPEKKPYNIIAIEAENAKDKVKAINEPLNPLGNDFKGGGTNRDGFYDQYVWETGIPY